MGIGKIYISYKSEDIITIYPEITFFKKVYKRHTNFGIEFKEQWIKDGLLKFGESTEIEINKIGSLISDIYINFSLLASSGYGGVNNNEEDISGDSGGLIENYKNYAHWVNSVGYAIIDKIDLFIGDTLIDTHTGLWFDIWNELTDPNRKEWTLVGKHDTPRINYIEDLTNVYVIPLKFYFNRNPGLALPIFLIEEKIKIKIKITFANINSLLNYGYKSTSPTTSIDESKAEIQNFKFYVKYIILDNNEEKIISNNIKNTYLIETLSILVDNVIDGNSYSILDNFDKLNILYPIKELIWVFRQNNRTTVGSATSSNYPGINFPGSDINNTFPNDIFNYSSGTINGSNPEISFFTMDSFSIIINNYPEIDLTSPAYFRLNEPYKYHSNIPGGYTNNEKSRYIYVYSFALNPEDYQPSGVFNFSKIDNKNIIFSITSAGGWAGYNYNLTMFAIKYEVININNYKISKDKVKFITNINELEQKQTQKEPKIEILNNLTKDLDI